VPRCCSTGEQWPWVSCVLSDTFVWPNADDMVLKSRSNESYRTSSAIRPCVIAAIYETVWNFYSDNERIYYIMRFLSIIGLNIRKINRIQTSTPSDPRGNLLNGRKGNARHTRFL
jgi:hypothetical protein